jgi:hypothetical protein
MRSSDRVIAGPQTGAVMTRPSFNPTASGTRSDAEATNPGRSSVRSTCCSAESAATRRVPETRRPSSLRRVAAPVLDVAAYAYGASVTAS